jgi:serine phosphatase RsbU (regulator of sigma subunit)
MKTRLARPVVAGGLMAAWCSVTAWTGGGSGSPVDSGITALLSVLFFASVAGRPAALPLTGRLAWVLVSLLAVPAALGAAGQEMPAALSGAFRGAGLLAGISALAGFQSLILTDRGRLTLRLYRLLLLLILFSSLVPAVLGRNLEIVVFERTAGGEDLSFELPAALVIIFSILNGLRARWVHYLDTRRKMLALAGSILAILACSLGLDAVAVPAGSDVGPSLLAGPVLHSLSTLSVLGMLSLLLSLPSARVMDRRNRQLRTIQAMGEVILEAVEQDEICSRAARLCRDLTGSDVSWVELEEPHESICAVSGSSVLIPGLPATGFSEWLESRGRGGRVSIFGNLPDSIPASLMRRSGMRIGSLLSSPVVAHGEKLGTIFAARSAKYGFPEDSSGLFEAFAGQVAVALWNSRLIEAGLERERYQEELSLARSIQQSLLPSGVPPCSGFDIAAINEASTEVGGDYYDLVPVGGDLLIVIADVSGKGAAAALVMSGLQAGLHSIVQQDSDPAVLARRLNRLLCRSSEGERFVTFFAGRLSPSTGEFSYCNAGHDPPLLVTRGRPDQELSEGGLVLGVMEGAEYRCGTTLIEPGSSLVLYTDGITEAMSPAGEEFGRGRVAGTVASHHGFGSRELIDRILSAASGFSAGEPWNDDVTLVVVRRPARDGGAFQPSEVLDGDEGVEDREVPDEGLRG